MPIKESYSKLHPIWRWLLLGIAGLLVLLIMLQILIGLFADNYLADQLNRQIAGATDSTYTIQFEDLDLNLLTGSATVKKLRIQARSDSSKGTSVSGTTFQGTVGKIGINGMNIFSGVWGKELQIGSIVITNPDLQLLK